MITESDIRMLEQLVDKLTLENSSLILENNSLKNLVRSLPETRETSKAREIVGLRRFEDRIESENAVEPSTNPLYLGPADEVDLTNEARGRKYRARANRSNAGLTNIFPIEIG